MFPGEEIYWFVPGYAIIWLLFFLSLSLASYRLFYLFRLLRLGRKENRFNHPFKRLILTLKHVFLQICSLRSVSLKDWAGIGHTIIFWGFIICVLGYIISIFIAEGMGLRWILGVRAFSFYFAYLWDIFSILVALAIIWAFIRRYIIAPPRLERTAEAGIILILIFSLMLSYLFMEGLREPSTPIREFFSQIFKGWDKEAKEDLFLILWWLHYLIILGFLVYIPFSKHLHIIASPFNIFFSSLAPKGSLPSIELEKAEYFGVDRVERFSWKQLLEGFACTHCGRCQVNCPAWISGKPLNPKELILKVKEHLLKFAPSLLSSRSPQTRPDLISEVITEEVIWECMTCRACQEECPVLNEHIIRIIDMRRHLVLERGKIPETAEGALRSLEVRGHPWRGTTATRTQWFEGLGIETLSQKGNAEYLYWVGCTAALEDRNMKIAKTFAQLLKKSGVDFAVLGAEEVCCGEPARKIGNEYIFQLQAKQNIETFKRYKVKKIFTTCPHCFNTLKNEYPNFGGDFEVLHHSQFLSSLIKQGKIKPKGLAQSVTYHDSCYLGRYNDIYEEPREVLKQIPGLKLLEMERRRKKGFCCGGGGGRMWQEETIGKRINQIRVEEVINTKASIVATACPFCIQMIEDGIKAKGKEESLKAYDLAEILSLSL